MAILRINQKKKPSAQRTGKFLDINIRVQLAVNANKNCYLTIKPTGATDTVDTNTNVFPSLSKGAFFLK